MLFGVGTVECVVWCLKREREDKTGLGQSNTKIASIDSNFGLEI